MFATASAFVFCLSLTGVVGLKRCPPPSAPFRGTVACFRRNDSVSCATASFAGSLAEFSCLQFYKLSPEDRRITRCLSNGTWTLPSPKCIPGGQEPPVFCTRREPLDLSEESFTESPQNSVGAGGGAGQNKRKGDCGRRSSSVSLILKGAMASRGAFPWHAALYHLVDGAYEYWCGGSLVSETAVITAAHCVWEVPPERLMLAFGKMHREYGFVERNVQKIRAKRVETLESYQDVGGNYNGDIAVVVLERGVRVGHYSAPVCVDWGQELMEREVAEGRSGVVVGWGLTEKETLSDGLRAVRLSVVSDERCIAEQEREFRKFVTYTSFCAGAGNGSGVCNGDSGGGLAFFDEGSGRWYLQGVVSVSPRRRGTPYCDPRFYTVFTKVGMFSKWLSGLRGVKGEFAPQGGLPVGDGSKDSGLGLVFPHTRKMLQLADLSASPFATPATPSSHRPPLA